MIELLETIWNHPIAPAAGVLLGAVVARLWQQYLQRMVTVRWSATHTTLAAGGEHPTWGHVEILYNGTPAGNLLQWCRVEIENESGSRDLSNIVVSLQYDQPKPEILSGGGTREGSNQWLALTPSFVAEIDRYIQTPETNRPKTTDIFRRRDFVIPVLNRGTKAIFLFLVRPNVANPMLRVYCDHLTVRLKHRAERPMIFGVVQAHAGWAGLGVGCLAAVALATSLRNIWVAVFVALLLGTFGQLLGVAVVRMWRWLVRAIG